MKSKRTIEQTAIETGLTSDTLRYYERIGLITGIERASNGHRRYTADDIVWINFLKQLRATGMPIARMKHFAQLRREGDSTRPQRRQILEQHRQNLREQVQMIEDFITVIDGKIANHLSFEKSTQGANPDENLTE